MLESWVIRLLARGKKRKEEKGGEVSSQRKSCLNAFQKNQEEKHYK